MHPQMAIVTLHCVVVLCNCFITKFARKFRDNNILDILVMNKISFFKKKKNNWTTKIDNNNKKIITIVIDNNISLK